MTPDEREIYRKRRAVVGKDERGCHWSVDYYANGQHRFLIDFDRWDAALIMALRWVGLES